MSKKPRHQPAPAPPPRTEPLPTIPTLFCDCYRYNITPDGLVTLYFGREQQWHIGFVLTAPLAIDLHQKLGSSIADVIIRDKEAERAAQVAVIPVDKPA